jgi:4-amino-4-deoxy-L-arabinose transferase-like glycosyltransferase
MSSHESSQAKAPAPLHFSCPHCARRLKTRADLAGTQVQCPHCKQIVTAPQPAAQPIWRMLAPPLVMAVVLWSTFVLKLHNLDHSGLTRWDEVFHAVVAQNVMKHPLEPTLVDVPYLPYDYTKWGENHVWLHKPILPFWQIAVSLAVLGVNAFALRLPSAILSTGAALLTYFIGKELFDRRTALIAASLQAVNPFVVKLIHGYQFADAIDIALLFWVEVGIYFLVRALRTASWTDVLLAGVAQGLAFLSKSYLAGIIFGVALALWLLPMFRLTKREPGSLGFIHLLGLLGATLLTIAPWQIHCMVNFPDEFAHEHAQVWRHLYDNVEDWAAPWDRVVFDYLVAIHGVFYTPILMAMIALIGKTLTRRHVGLWLLYAWSLGVVVPHLCATTKTPSATLIAMPAMLLLLGHLIAEASRGERWPLVALTAILFMSVVMPAVIRNPGHGYPSVFGGVIRQALWVLYHVGGALAISLFATGLWWPLRTRLSGILLERSGRAVTYLFCAGALIWLGLRTVDTAWQITNINLGDPHHVEVGHFAREQLPENAVLFCQMQQGHEHLVTMFYADRTCYPLVWNRLDASTEEVVQAGGIPYVVTARRLPHAPLHVCGQRGPAVYVWERQK